MLIMNVQACGEMHSDTHTVHSAHKQLSKIYTCMLASLKMCSETFTTFHLYVTIPVVKNEIHIWLKWMHSKRWLIDWVINWLDMDQHINSDLKRHQKAITFSMSIQTKHAHHMTVAAFLVPYTYVGDCTEWFMFSSGLKQTTRTNMHVCGSKQLIPVETNSIQLELDNESVWL